MHALRILNFHVRLNWTSKYARLRTCVSNARGTSASVVGHSVISEPFSAQCQVLYIPAWNNIRQALFDVLVAPEHKLMYRNMVSYISRNRDSRNFSGVIVFGEISRKFFMQRFHIV